MLTRTGEHALRAVLLLAQRRDELVPSAAIARELDAPSGYLAKTLSELAQRGLVEGRRGPGGGYRLAVEPAELTLAGLLDGFEPALSDRCLLNGRDCDAHGPCAAHERWSQVQLAVREPLNETTIADLLPPA